MGMVDQYGIAPFMGRIPVNLKPSYCPYDNITEHSCRVTLDYATSTHHLASLDPFAPTHYTLSIPLPTAVSAFVIPHRSSANFFDLFERAEIWRRLDGLGVRLTRVDGNPHRLGVEGVRMVGGVPT